MSESRGRLALYTIFRCTNYGAVLQAFALTRVLRGIVGEDRLDVINHLMDSRDTHLLGKIANPNTPWFQRWRNRRKFAARYFHPELFELRRQSTIKLIENFIRPTQRLYKRPSQLHDLPPYRTVVVGSDQVWKPALNHDFDHNQYLCVDFPESQDRVAYAASFGVVALPGECVKEYRAALSRFRAITVREETGARICSELLPSVAPQTVLDPTLLMTAEEWRAIVFDGSGKSNGLGECEGHNVHSVPNSANPASGRYLVAYWVRLLTQADVDRLSNISRSHGAPVCLLSAGPLPKLDFPSSVVPYVNADPFDFVRVIAGSMGVVTDSFHGLQFAAVFRKPFIALGDLSKAGTNVSRLTDFCRRYGVENGVRDLAEFRLGSMTADFAGADFDAALMDKDRGDSFAALKKMLAPVLGEGV